MKIKYKGYIIHISYKAFIENKEGKILVSDACDLIEIEGGKLQNVVKYAKKSIEEHLVEEKGI
jgi:hypothetical protein